MSYHAHPVVNRLLLTVINDGDGQQCGASYAARCGIARGVLSAWDFHAMVRTASRGVDRVHPDYTAVVAEAAAFLWSYYRDHVAEIDRDHVAQHDRLAAEPARAPILPAGRHLAAFPRGAA